IRYALNSNPVIFDFLVKQFWSTTTLRAPELGPPAILTTIDKTPYTITEELIRSRLQLADDGAMLLQAQAGGGAEVAEQAVPHPMPSLDHSPSDHKHLTQDDAPLGGDLHPSPPRFSHAPLAGQPSRAELHDHKKLFKDVVGKLVKKVKTLETKKRKMVVSDSDQEDDTTQNVDLDALHALANAAVAANSDIPSGNTSHVPASSPCVPTAGPPGTSDVPPAPSAIPLGASSVSPGPSIAPNAASAVLTDSLKVPADNLNIPAGVSEEDRLGEEATKRLYAEEMAKMERERAEAQRKRQHEVFKSAMFFNEANWLNIRAQVEANASLTKTLLGDDVSEDNFPAQMAALIKKKRQALAEKLFKERHNRPMTLAQQKAYMRQYVKNQSSAIYNTRWTMAYVKSFSDEQLLHEFEKIRKSPKAPTPSIPEVSISPSVTSPPSSCTRRKSLGHSVNEVWSAVIGWEVLPTPLGEINALYRIDGTTKHFATLRQILHMVDRQDLMKLYGLVV
nr:hypothetical protein [Tanacetum cinerariifolium]